MFEKECLQPEVPALRGAPAGLGLGAACAAQGFVGGHSAPAKPTAKRRGEGFGAVAPQKVAQRPAWVADRLQAFGLQRLLQSARECPDDGCLIWAGLMKRGSARISFAQGGKEVFFDARRLVWELVHGYAPPAHLSPRCACNELCFHPDHLRLRPRASTPANRQLWRKNLAAGQRAKSPVTLEAARSIRASAEPLRVVAQRHGCSVATASKIRRGLVWQEPGFAFAGMGEGWRS